MRPKALSSFAMKVPARISQMLCQELTSRGTPCLVQRKLVGPCPRKPKLCVWRQGRKLLKRCRSRLELLLREGISRNELIYSLQHRPPELLVLDSGCNASDQRDALEIRSMTKVADLTAENS